MRKRFWSRNENGQTMVEFTLILPILCLLLFGIVQMGIVFHDYVTLTDAARVGARVATVSRSDPNPIGKVAAAVKKSAVGLDATKLGTTVTSSWAIGSEVTVTATYPYDVSLLGVVVASGSLTSTTTERVEP